MMGLSSFNMVATPWFHRAISSSSSFAVAVAVGVAPYMEFREHVRRLGAQHAARLGVEIGPEVADAFQVLRAHLVVLVPCATFWWCHAPSSAEEPACRRSFIPKSVCTSLVRYTLESAEQRTLGVGCCS